MYMYYFIFKRITKKKSDMNSFMFFCYSYSKMTIFKLTIFKASVFIRPSSLLAIFLIVQGSIILVKVY
jgi:hypothetical protein